MPESPLRLAPGRRKTEITMKSPPVDSRLDKIETELGLTTQNFARIDDRFDAMEALLRQLVPKPTKPDEATYAAITALEQEVNKDKQELAELTAPLSSLARLCSSAIDAATTATRILTPLGPLTSRTLATVRQATTTTTGNFVERMPREHLLCRSTLQPFRRTSRVGTALDDPQLDRDNQCTVIRHPMMRMTALSTWYSVHRSMRLNSLFLTLLNMIRNRLSSLIKMPQQS
jgi:hypothetical protein